MRGQTSDLRVFTGVYIAKELEFDELAEGLIIDGGANIGASTRYLAAKYPDREIIAVEPSQANVEMLRKNTEHLENVQILEGGLWSHEGRLRIANSDAEAWAFQCETTDKDDPDGFDGFMIDGVIAAGSGGCGLLKLDVEGAELELFKSHEAWLKFVERIVIETHGDDARSIVLQACPSTEWHIRETGEKLDLLRLI